MSAIPERKVEGGVFEGQAYLYHVERPYFKETKKKKRKAKI